MWRPCLSDAMAPDAPPGGAKRAKYTPLGMQASALERLMQNPDKPVKLPEPTQEKSVRPPPDMVPNVNSSTAGAGSGEFHVYTQARQREYERLGILAEKAKRVRAMLTAGKAACGVPRAPRAAGRRGRAQDVQEPRAPREEKAGAAACEAGKRGGRRAAQAQVGRCAREGAPRGSGRRRDDGTRDGSRAERRHVVVR